MKPIIYLDNAATTQMDSEVVEVMQKSMLDVYGNPSSIHQFGRKAKVAVETARKNIAKHFNAASKQIVFTSGATEANNWVLFNAVENLGVKRIITSKLEHHAVLKVVDELERKFGVVVVYVDVDEFGVVDLIHLEELLKSTTLKTLVSLMMVNNEIGNVLPIKEVSVLCKSYQSFFHSDTVQAIGRYYIDVKEIAVDFMVASAHKFHGPKGVGFVCCSKESRLGAYSYGGGQEKGLRSGTENVHAILGMEKALSLAYSSLDKDVLYVSSLKEQFVAGLKSEIEGVLFNGLSSSVVGGSCGIINVRFPKKDPMLLFNLDLAGVLVSVGSACGSGAQKTSHVLKNILTKEELEKTSLRFSFSRFNKKEEIKGVLMKIKEFTCFKGF